MNLSNSKKILLFTIKGGSAKTTSACNLAGALAKSKKTLLIDTDGQSNVLTSFKRQLKTIKTTVDMVLDQDANMNDAIIEDIGIDNLDVIPSSSNLHQVAMKFATKDEGFFKKKLEEIVNDYEYLIFDSSPFPSPLNSSLIEMVDIIVIPTILDTMSIKQAAQAIQTIKSLKTKAKIVVLPTMVRNNTVLHNQLLHSLEKDVVKPLGATLLKVSISNSIIVPTVTATEGKPLSHSTKWDTKPGKEYAELAKEVIKILGGK